MKNAPAVGVYFAARPDSGGTFQYNLSILRGLESLARIGWSVTAFYEERSWDVYLPSQFTRVLSERSLPRKILRRVFKFLNPRIISDPCRAGVFQPVLQKINQSDCDVIVFPSQDALSYSCTKKTLATIHDLMHRYARQFEEYARGEFEEREAHYRNMCRYCDGILVDSEMGKAQVVESHGKDSGAVFPLPFVPPFYLTESTHIDVRSKYALPARYIFYPAQFWEHKNHIRLLKAIGILRDSGLNVDLVLAGSEKNNFEKTMAVIQELDLSKQVKILGYVPNEDMASLYRKAAAMVFVSLIGPTNIPPLEAMVLGCPLICSNACAMPEQVGDGGLMVDALDPEDIAEKIKSLWLDENLRQEYAQRGKKRADAWTQELFNHRFQEILETLIERPALEKISC